MHSTEGKKGEYRKPGYLKAKKSTAETGSNSFQEVPEKSHKGGAKGKKVKNPMLVDV